MKGVNALVAVALALGCGTVQAGLTNPGFETGDTTGWDVNVPDGIVDFAYLSRNSEFNPPDGVPPLSPPPPSPPYPADYPYTYTPPEGDYFLMIGSGLAYGDLNPELSDWQTVSQTIRLAQGELLSGIAALDRDDNGQYLDAARVRILDDQGNQIGNPLFYMDGASAALNPFFDPLHPVSSLSNYGNGPWLKWSWTALAAGTYTLEYGVANTVDVNLNSFGYFDTVPAAVTEPASLALFVIGLAGLSSMQRRRAISLSRSS